MARSIDTMGKVIKNKATLALGVPSTRFYRSLMDRINLWVAASTIGGLNHVKTGIQVGSSLLFTSYALTKTIHACNMIFFMKQRELCPDTK